jgi:hypothetical protein
MNDNIILGIRLKLNDLKDDLSKAKKLLRSNFSDSRNKDVSELEQKVYNQTKKLNAELNKSANSVFPGWAMSIMFAGMALERFSNTLIQFGTKAYDEISHSVVGTITQTDRLNGAMQFLGFSIGDALQPLIGFLVPIVESLAEWVTDNNSLVAGIMAVGAAFGKIAMVGGGLYLAGFGLDSFIGKIKDTNWTQLGSNLANKLMTGIGILSIVVGVSNIIEGLDEFDGSLNKFLKTMGGTLETVGGLMLIKGSKGGVWVAAIGFALDEASKGTLVQSFKGLLMMILGIGNAIESEITVIMNRIQRLTDKTIPKLKFADEFQRTQKEGEKLIDMAFNSISKQFTETTPTLTPQQILDMTNSYGPQSKVQLDDAGTKYANQNGNITMNGVTLNVTGMTAEQVLKAIQRITGRSI